MQKLIEEFLSEQYPYINLDISVNLGDDNETYIATAVADTTTVYLFHKFYVEIVSAPKFSNLDSDRLFSQLSQSYRSFIYSHLKQTNPEQAISFKEEWNQLAENAKQKMIEEVNQAKL